MSVKIPSVIRNGVGERLDFAVTRPDGAASRGLVIVGHGVTSHHDRPYLARVAEAVAARGWTALRLTFAGNGASEGRFAECTLSKEVEDLGTVIDAIDAPAVVYVGHSMGGAVGALRGGIDTRIDALVSLAGMTHVQAFMHEHFAQLTPGLDTMLGREHAVLSQALLDDAQAIDTTLASAASGSCPWLLIHGTADDLVPDRDSIDIARAIGDRATLQLLDGVDHVFTDHFGDVAERVATWLDTLP